MEIAINNKQQMIQGINGLAQVVQGLKQIEDYMETMVQLEDKYEKMNNNIALIQENIEQKNKEIESLNDDINKLKERTLILATDNGKKKEWTKTIQSLAYTYNGGRNTLEYELFHRTIINDCYAHIYNFYQINTYVDIKIDDYDEAIKLMRKWFGNKQNIKKSRNRKIRDLIQKIDKGTIKEYERELCNKYLNQQGEDM